MSDAPKKPFKPTGEFKGVNPDPHPERRGMALVKEKRTTGGRPKGSKNTKPALLRRAANTYKVLPLEFMLRIMTDEEQPLQFRFEAAKSAAPYIHPRLAQIQQTIEDKREPTKQELEDRMREVGVDPEVFWKLIA